MGISSKSGGIGDSVQTGEIDDNAITLAKLAGGTADKVIGFDSSGDPAEIDKASLVLLDNYEASIAEATHTFTPSVALSNNDYSKFIVVIDLEATGSFSLQMVINALEGTLNLTRGFYTTGGAITHISIAGAAACTLKEATYIAANQEVIGTVEIYLNDISVQDIGAISQFYNVVDADMNHLTHKITASATTITSIEIKASTSSWKIGTKISMYGVLRS